MSEKHVDRIVRLTYQRSAAESPNEKRGFRQLQRAVGRPASLGPHHRLADTHRLVTAC